MIVIFLTIFKLSKDYGILKFMVRENNWKDSFYRGNIKLKRKVILKGRNL